MQKRFSIAAKYLLSFPMYFVIHFNGPPLKASFGLIRHKKETVLYFYSYIVVISELDVNQAQSVSVSGTTACPKFIPGAIYGPRYG